MNFSMSDETKKTINEKKENYCELLSQQVKLLSEFNRIKKDFVTKYQLKSSIKLEQMRVELLKNEIKSILIKINDHKETVKMLKKRVSTKISTINVFKEKINQIKGKNKKSEKEKNKIDSNQYLNNVKTSIIEYQKQNLHELNKYVFNLIEVKPKLDEAWLQTSTITALNDARKTIHMDGRWIKTNDSHSDYHQIVQSKLQSNGNFLNYISDSLKDNQILMEIKSALTYATQFVNLIAYFLNATLPYNVSHKKVCSETLKENELIALSTKLNVNIIYLCIHQGIPLPNRQPNHALEYLNYFLDYIKKMSTQVRQKYAIEYDWHTVDCLEKMFKNVDDSVDFSDFEMIRYDVPSNEYEEWETLPNSNEIPMDSTNPAVTQLPNHRGTTVQSTTAAAAASLISSSTSLFSSFTSYFSRRLTGTSSSNAPSTSSNPSRSSLNNN